MLLALPVGDEAKASPLSVRHSPGPFPKRKEAEAGRVRPETAPVLPVPGGHIGPRRKPVGGGNGLAQARAAEGRSRGWHSGKGGRDAGPPEGPASPASWQAAALRAAGHERTGAGVFFASQSGVPPLPPGSFGARDRLCGLSREPAFPSESISLLAGEMAGGPEGAP